MDSVRMIMNDWSVTQVIISRGCRIATMAGMNVTHSSFAGLDLLASAVLLLDDALAIRYINAAGENLLAVSSRAVIGQTLTAVCTCSATLQSALDNGLNNNWGYTGQNVELKRSDGEVLNINCTVTPLRPDIAPGVRLLLELQPIQHHLAATREERLIEQQQVSRELIRNLAHESRIRSAAFGAPPSCLSMSWPIRR